MSKSPAKVQPAAFRVSLLNLSGHLMLIGLVGQHRSFTRSGYFTCMHTYLHPISKVSSIFHWWLFFVPCYPILNYRHQPDICQPSIHLHSGQCRSQNNRSTSRLRSTGHHRWKNTGCFYHFSMARHLWCQVLVSLFIPKFDKRRKKFDHVVVVCICYDDPCLGCLRMHVVH